MALAGIIGDLGALERDLSPAEVRVVNAALTARLEAARPLPTKKQLNRLVVDVVRRETGSAATATSRLPVTRHGLAELQRIARARAAADAKRRAEREREMLERARREGAAAERRRNEARDRQEQRRAAEERRRAAERRRRLVEQKRRQREAAARRRRAQASRRASAPAVAPQYVAPAAYGPPAAPPAYGAPAAAPTRPAPNYYAPPHRALPDVDDGDEAVERWDEDDGAELEERGDEVESDEAPPDDEGFEDVAEDDGDGTDDEGDDVGALEAGASRPASRPLQLVTGVAALIAIGLELLG